MSTQEEVLEKVDVQEEQTPFHEIVLYNDDVNTFDFVIDSLIKVCDHSPIQAEQCTFLVHFKGKCSVKSGEYKELEPRCTKLLELGLSAEIV
ncbi:MAG: ATP-dependent Clp protease adaptor ClpS [Polaribacter sp.]|jgi:ATP-dependent Clp protease adaptor protein ClpS